MRKKKAEEVEAAAAQRNQEETQRKKSEEKERRQRQEEEQARKARASASGGAGDRRGTSGSGGGADTHLQQLKNENKRLHAQLKHAEQQYATERKTYEAAIVELEGTVADLRQRVGGSPGDSALAVVAWRVAAGVAGLIFLALFARYIDKKSEERFQYVNEMLAGLTANQQKAHEPAKDAERGADREAAAGPILKKDAGTQELDGKASAEVGAGTALQAVINTSFASPPATPPADASAARRLYRELVETPAATPDTVRYLNYKADPNLIAGATPKTVYLEEDGTPQGALVLFPDASQRRGWVLPNPSHYFRGPALLPVFPGLTEETYETRKQDIQPVLAELVEAGRWVVRPRNERF